MTGSALLRSIGEYRLTGYFSELDTVNEFGVRDMSKAKNVILEMHPDVSECEAAAIARAWSETFSETLIAEDRATDAIKAAR